MEFIRSLVRQAPEHVIQCGDGGFQLFLGVFAGDEEAQTLLPAATAGARIPPR